MDSGLPLLILSAVPNFAVFVYVSLIFKVTFLFQFPAPCILSFSVIFHDVCSSIIPSPRRGLFCLSSLTFSQPQIVMVSGGGHMWLPLAWMFSIHLPLLVVIISFHSYWLLPPGWTIFSACFRALSISSSHAFLRVHELWGGTDCVMSTPSEIARIQLFYVLRLLISIISQPYVIP